MTTITAHIARQRTRPRRRLKRQITIRRGKIVVVKAPGVTDEQLAACILRRLRPKTPSDDAGELPTPPS